MATTWRRVQLHIDTGDLASERASDAPPSSGATAAATCHALAQLIDVSLTWAFLLAGMAQTLVLSAMIAGQVFR